VPPGRAHHFPTGVSSYSVFPFLSIKFCYCFAICVSAQFSVQVMQELRIFWTRSSWTTQPGNVGLWLAALHSAERQIDDQAPGAAGRGAAILCSLGRARSREISLPVFPASRGLLAPWKALCFLGVFLLPGE
jgi:hypothetical protein